MNAHTKGRAMRGLRQGRGGFFAALRATALQPAMTFDDWLDLRKIDFIVFPDHRARLIFSKRPAAMEAMRRAVIFNDVRLFGEVAGMPLVAMLRAAGTRPLPLCLPVGRWWFRRCPRSLIGMLQTQHQLHQFRLRKPLEFLPIHRQDESHTGSLGKGVGSYL